MIPLRLTIKQLFIYPVKSLAGIEVTEWPALRTGFKWDRQFMLINEKGTFVSQRQLPEMVLIQPSINDDRISFTCENACETSLSLSEERNDQDIITARIWKDVCDTYEPSATVSEWFSDILKCNVRLVALANKRPQSSPARFGQDTTTFFADAAPYLVANQASLVALNASLQQQGMMQVDMRRFRPNIIIDGELGAFAEHDYTQLRNENYDIELLDHCQRCIVTTIDPDKGIKDKDLEPFKTNAILNSMPSNAKAPAFGVNALFVSNAPKHLRVGDTLLALR